MSWLNHRAAALAALLLVGGCGFQPIAATNIRGGGATIALSDITITAASDRVAYTLRQELMRHVEITPDAPYALSIDVAFTRTGLAITAKDEITRYILSARAAFDLTPADDAQPPISSVVDTETSLNATSSVLSTDVLAEETRLNLSRDIARRILTRMRQRRLRDAVE